MNPKNEDGVYREVTVICRMKKTVNKDDVYSEAIVVYNRYVLELT